MVRELGGAVYVAVSGGKDSQVLAHIVKDLYPNVPCIFVNTGLEFDSVRQKGIELSDTVLRPKMDFVSVITKYGYPIISKRLSHDIEQVMRNPQTSAYAKYFDGSQKGKSIYDKSKYGFLLDAPFRISDKCCNVMKKAPFHKYVKESGRYPIVGTMASESQQRKVKWFQFGCNAFDASEPQSNPISFWTEQDILAYIKRYKLEIADIYGDIVYKDNDGMFYDEPLFNENMELVTTGEKRTGCVFCMFGITQDTERFLRLKEQEPKKYDFVMRGGKFDEYGKWIPHEGLGYKFVIDWMNEHGNLNIKY